jgi:hypothetical protein
MVCPRDNAEVLPSPPPGALTSGLMPTKILRTSLREGGRLRYSVAVSNTNSISSSSASGS